MTSYCSSCGADLAPNVHFCSSCGKPAVNGDELATIEIAALDLPTVTSPLPPKPSFRLVALIVTSFQLPLIIRSQRGEFFRADSLLPLAVAIFTINMVSNVPFSADFSAWYMPTSILALLSVLLLVGWGFYHSLAGQTLWKLDMD